MVGATEIGCVVSISSRLFPSVFLSLFFACCTFPSSAQQTFSMLTYNCENLFDTLHDAGHDDYEFLPEGRNRWTRARYWRKLQRVAQVFAMADTLKPIDVAVLEEVENDTVLTHLLQRTKLQQAGYEYVMTDSRTARGTDVAVVFSPYTFHFISSETISLHHSKQSADNNEDTRPILYVCGTLQTGDTLDLYALHFPSKLGAHKADVLRRNIGKALRQHVDSVMHSRQFPLVVITGDFNDGPRSEVCRKVLNAQPPTAASPDAYTLYNMMTGRKGGSYKWHGEWNWIDQVLLNGNALRTDSPLHCTFDDVSAIHSPFLLEPDEAYGGSRPRRTFYGPVYHGGYSDHLPVVIRFQLQNR